MVSYIGAPAGYRAAGASTQPGPNRKEDSLDRGSNKAEREAAFQKLQSERVAKNLEEDRERDAEERQERKQIRQEEREEREQVRQEEREASGSARKREVRRRVPHEQDRPGHPTESRPLLLPLFTLVRGSMEFSEALPG
jgi:hypothetical protein